MTNGDRIRSALEKILRDTARPATSHDLVVKLRFQYGIDINALSVGIYLGHLRIALLVDRKSVVKWGDPYWFRGKWNFATENWWYHRAVVSRLEMNQFAMKKRIEVETRARDNQRSKGRPVTRVLPARSDDMRQLVEDIQRNR